MTVEEREHYENLARYYNSKKEPCKTEMMKFKCVVEYEYPHEHKPPIQAEIYLHGDKVLTEEITPIRTGIWIDRICNRCAYKVADNVVLGIFKYCPCCGAKMEMQK